MSSYSKTSLIKKLGLRNGDRYFFFNPPDHYLSLLGALPENAKSLSEEDESADFIHAFIKNFDELEAAIVFLKPMMMKDAILWLSWPKKSSSVATDLTRDRIREFVLANGLVDVKVASVDEVWSGLKFVYRLIDR